MRDFPAAYNIVCGIVPVCDTGASFDRSYAHGLSEHEYYCRRIRALEDEVARLNQQVEIDGLLLRFAAPTSPQRTAAIRKYFQGVAGRERGPISQDGRIHEARHDTMKKETH